MMQPPIPPPLYNATAESLISDTNRRLKEARAVHDDIVANVTPQTATFFNTLLPFVQEENRRLYERQLTEFYGKVSPREDVREASREAEELYSDFDIELALRDDLYALVAAVRGKSETLDVESARLLEKLLLDFEKNGLALPEQGRVRLRQLNKDLNEIEREYLNCIDENQCGLWLSRDELQGVSNDILTELEHGVGLNDGKLRLKFRGMRYSDVMSTADHQGTRRRIYVEYANSCKANVPLLEKAIVLRDEKARLLGYASFSELEMADNMEKSPQKVQAFLEALLEKVVPARDELVREWRWKKREDLKARREDDDGKLYAWDRQYYSRKCSAEKNAVDEQKVREYFALDETVKRMLDIFEKVMGLCFEEIANNKRKASSQAAGGESLVWHEKVRLFAVWDDGDGSGRTEFLGYLYMDLYAREGKRGCFSDQPIRPAFTEADGSRRHTSTGLLCSFNKPTSGKPCLLAHREVVVLFHELGHGIHDLVAKTRYARFHGASTPGDFNEAPSQMLEEWCWTPSTLRMLSQHYSNLSPAYLHTWQSERGDSTSGDAKPLGALPEDVIEKMIKSKKRSNMHRCIALLNLSLFDMAISNVASHEAAKALDTTQLHHSTAHRVWGVDMPDEFLPFQASEAFVFTVSGMYAYLVSQVYSSEMFHVFLRNGDGLMDEEVGRRYRHTILEKGSSQDEMHNLIAFLDHQPTAEALYEELGLK